MRRTRLLTPEFLRNANSISQQNQMHKRNIIRFYATRSHQHTLLSALGCYREHVKNSQESKETKEQTLKEIDNLTNQVGLSSSDIPMMRVSK